MSAVLWAALLLAGASDRVAAPRRGEYERPIGVASPGKVFAALDRDVYERARADLGDLRVFDDRDRQVPYLLEAAREEPDTARREPRILNRTFVRGQSSSVTLDFGSPVLKSELGLSLSGDNFRRRVTVEGRNRHHSRWETLTDGAYVFAVPPPAAARYETVRLPENNFQFLQVTVHDGPDEERPVEVQAAWTRAQERRRARELERPLPLRAAEDEAAHETRIVIDLGARHQPFRGILLDVADPQFFRGVSVEARKEPLRPSDEPYWRPLAEGTIYRYDGSGHPLPRPPEGRGRTGDTHHEQLRIEVGGRERMLRLRIRNRDDRPLQLRGLTLLTPLERLVFEAEPQRTYTLSYGSDALGAPVYDVARTVGDPGLWIAQAAEATLGVPVRRAHVDPQPPWTERHPALVWAGLAVLVLLLGMITWRALRAADGAGHEARPEP